MQAYYVNHRLGSAPSGEMEKSPLVMQNPYELLNATYQQADLTDITDGFKLIHSINNAANPIAIAMTISEAREVFERGPEIRHADSRKFFQQADPNALVVIEPIGVNAIKTHTEYLPDLARSGKNFPTITDEYVWPDMFTKNLKGETIDIGPMPDHYDIVLQMAKRPTQPEFRPVKLESVDRQAQGIPFPEDESDVNATDAYFFANVGTTAQILAERQGRGDDENFTAGISVTLNHAYSVNPGRALEEIHDVLTGGVSITVTQDDIDTTQAHLRDVEEGRSRGDRYPIEPPSENTGVDPEVEAAQEEAEREEWIYRRQGFFPETENVSWQAWNEIYFGDETANSIDDELNARFEHIVSRNFQIEEMERTSDAFRKTTSFSEWQAKIREAGVEPSEVGDEVLQQLYEDEYDRGATYEPGDREKRSALRARIITLENSLANASQQAASQQ